MMRQSYSYATSNPRAVAHPLRSLPLYGAPAERITGYSAQQLAEYALANARRYLPAIEEGYRHACTVLGRANRVSDRRFPGTRRRHQAEAMRCINRARAALRRARQAVVVAEAAMLAFAPSTAA